MSTLFQGLADVDTLNLNIFEFVQAQIDSSLDFCEGSDSVLLTSNSNLGFGQSYPLQTLQQVGLSQTL